MTEPTVFAIDWSGAKNLAGQRKGICVATARGSGVETSAGRTRIQTIEFVEKVPAPVVVGLDFSFGVPEWFAREHSCRSIADVWSLAERDGERWLEPTRPFWNKRNEVPLERRFRRCELALAPAKSIFQLVGIGQVGPGSVRGMPLLTRLRANGFAIWPFDTAAERTVFEIYPSRLRKLAPHHDVGPFADEHERDAVVSARVMWEHRASFATLEATTDPTTLIEGDVWLPSAWP